MKSLPSRAPGVIEGPRDSAAVAEISRALMASGMKNVKIVASAAEVGAAIRASFEKPDVVMNPATPEVGFIHRGLHSAPNLLRRQHRQPAARV